jgi:hypothetical protein
MKRTFWMVLGEGRPNYRHTTIESARAEAERLARQHPEREFFVLESVAMVKKTNVQWENCHQDFDEQMPF